MKWTWSGITKNTANRQMQRTWFSRASRNINGAISLNGGRGATALPAIVGNFKHLLASRYGIRFQRDFFDTRLRNDADYAEKYDYILGNPVRKGLCTVQSEWPYSILFDR